MRETRRLSILSLSGWVAVAALWLAALRSESDEWLGATVLATWSILSLTVIGAICRRGVERAWWLGFSVFGWGYLALIYAGFPLPTGLVLRALERLIHPPGSTGSGAPAPFSTVMSCLATFNPAIFQIGNLAAHQMCALLVATLGGWSSARLFGGKVDGPTLDRAGWDTRRVAARGSAAIAGFVVLALPGLRWVPGPTAGLVLVLTFAALGLTVLGALCNAGVRRASYLGAAGFGVGFLVMVLGPDTSVGYWPRVVTGRLLDAVEGWLPSPLVREATAVSDPSGRANQRIREALERPASLHFPDGVELGTLLKEVQAQMRRDGEPPVPVYIDPQGLMNADKTEHSPVGLDLEGVRLRTALLLALDQVSLTYLIIDGVLVITYVDEDEGLPDVATHQSLIIAPPLRSVGACMLALVAALVGGLLGPLVVPAPTTDAGRPAPVA